VSGGTNWKQVSAGTTHASAVKTDGTLWSWGVGSSGQLGNNGIDSVSSPVQTIAGGTKWKSVAAGYRQVIAISYIN
jgi:alpha-tubulin suppressor-like RCC1 family protein